MTTFIILTVLFVIGIALASKYEYEILGFIIAFLGGVLLLIHLCIWPFASYEYEKFVAKGQAIEMTLKSARESGNEYESASIMKLASEWNVSLMEMKFDNTNAFLDQYVDDRIDTLQPIQ